MAGYKSDTFLKKKTHPDHKYSVTFVTKVETTSDSKRKLRRRRTCCCVEFQPLELGKRSKLASELFQLGFMIDVDVGQ